MRSNLLFSLNNYCNSSLDDGTFTQNFLDFVTQNSNCFDRDHLIGHVTGSAWLINSRGTHVLLTHHKKLNRWLQLGGHADGNSNLKEVALNEAKEESGINDLKLLSEEIFDIDIHTIPLHNNIPEHLHYDVRYIIKTNSTDKFIVSGESHDLKWCQISEINSFTKEKSILRMAFKWENHVKEKFKLS